MGTATVVEAARDRVRSEQLVVPVSAMLALVTGPSFGHDEGFSGSFMRAPIGADIRLTGLAIVSFRMAYPSVNDGPVEGAYRRAPVRNFARTMHVQCCTSATYR